MFILSVRLRGQQQAVSKVLESQKLYGFSAAREWAEPQSPGCSGGQL